MRVAKAAATTDDGAGSYFGNSPGRQNRRGKASAGEAAMLIREKPGPDSYALFRGGTKVSRGNHAFSEPGIAAGSDPSDGAIGSNRFRRMARSIFSAVRATCSRLLLCLDTPPSRLK